MELRARRAGDHAQYRRRCHPTRRPSSSSDTVEFGLRASIGITSINGYNLTLEGLLKLGDRALDAAKATRRREVSGVPQLAC
jgi:GGDEF domain-containing protein